MFPLWFAFLGGFFVFLDSIMWREIVHTVDYSNIVTF
jgi:hypothetical protein